MDTGTAFLPPQMSTVASDIDALFWFIYIVSAFAFMVITVGTVYFAIRYRRQTPEHKLTIGFSHHLGLEVIWTVIPTIFFFAVFAWGFHSFMRLVIIPPNALEVNVTAMQWAWNFKYKEGVDSDKLVVPAGQPIKLLMSSKDVLHSLFIPDFRVKMDLVPNRYTSLWFQADEPGEYDLFCTEYCGQKHSAMLSRVIVVPPEDFPRWLESAAVVPDSPIEHGRLLWEKKQCKTCHTIDGSDLVGPSWQGLFGTQQEIIGGTVTVDENYIRESILEPMAKIRKGFPATMPAFKGMLNDDELYALIKFIESLNGETQP